MAEEVAARSERVQSSRGVFGALGTLFTRPTLTAAGAEAGAAGRHPLAAEEPAELAELRVELEGLKVSSHRR
jgi:hypothetical protein